MHPLSINRNIEERNMRQNKQTEYDNQVIKGPNPQHTADIKLFNKDGSEAFFFRQQEVSNQKTAHGKEECNTQFANDFDEVPLKKDAWQAKKQLDLLQMMDNNHESGYETKTIKAGKKDFWCASTHVCLLARYKYVVNIGAKVANPFLPIKY